MKVRTRREHVVSVQLQNTKRWTQIARALDKWHDKEFPPERWGKFGQNFYKLDQHKIAIPCSYGEWAVMMEQHVNRRVAYDEVDGYRVSTVFLGLDHNHFGMDGTDPILFESMTFAPVGDEDFEQAQQRYRTYAEAKAGHEQLLQMIKFQLTIAKKTVLLLPPPHTTPENPTT